MYSFYRTTNLVTGKVYYGIHKESKYPDIDSYLGSGVALTASVEKYGRGNFKREVLEYRNTIEEVYEIEKQVVTKELVECETTYYVEKVRV